MKQIPLSQNLFALVDDEDFQKLSKFNWSAWRNKKNFYAARKDERKKSILMHRVILNAPADMQVDHINGDGLDNRRVNLRLVTPRKNTLNRGVRSTNKTGYSGVYLDQRTNKFTARISLHIGSFDSFDEAVAARQKAEDKYYGKFTRRRSLQISKPLNTLQGK
ncbi:MAG: HNH endonuclease [Chloroflexi bacterium]|nr:HNH endonuclease [Chloroflexota bacterium]